MAPRKRSPWCGILVRLVATAWCISVSSAQNTGDIRLDGGGVRSGNLIVWYNGAWGTVCDDGFTQANAEVVCRQLGYDPLEATVRYYTAGGNYDSWVPIYMDDVSCFGTELRLEDCSFLGWGNHNCQHSEDVWVSCSETMMYNGDDYTGYVMVYTASYMWTVCQQGWDDVDANVFCRELGYQHGSAYTGSGYLAPPMDPNEYNDWHPYMSSVECTGSEASIEECPYRTDQSCAATEAEVARASCSSVRLIDANGNMGSEGLLQVYHDGEWGTVCAVGFDTTDAAVVCTELGLGGGVVLSDQVGAGQIFMSNIQCTGSESRLVDCPFSGWGVHSCSHNEDVGIRCGYNPFNEGVDALPRCTQCDGYEFTGEDVLRCDVGGCPAATWNCYDQPHGNGGDMCEVRPPDCQALVAEYNNSCAVRTVQADCAIQGVCDWVEPMNSIRWLCQDSANTELGFCDAITSKDDCDAQLGCVWDVVPIARSTCGVGDFLPCQTVSSDPSMQEMCGNLVTQSSCASQRACTWDMETACVCPSTHQGANCEVNVSLWRDIEGQCDPASADVAYCHGLTYASWSAEDSELCTGHPSCGKWNELKGILNLMFVLSVTDNAADSLSLMSQLFRICLRALMSKSGPMTTVLTWSLLITFATDVAGPIVVWLYASKGLEILEQLKDSFCFSVGAGYETLVATAEQFESVVQFNIAMAAVGLFGMIAEAVMMCQEQDADPTTPEVVAFAVSVLASLAESGVGFVDLFVNILKAVAGLNDIENAILNIEPLSQGHVCVQLNPVLEAPADPGVTLDTNLAFMGAGAAVLSMCLCSGCVCCRSLCKGAGADYDV